MTSFKSALKEELIQSQSNNFGIENFDEHRFGEMVVHPVPRNTIFQSSKQFVKKIIGYKRVQQVKPTNEFIDHLVDEIKKYEEGLEFLYENLNAGNKKFNS